MPPKDISDAAAGYNAADETSSSDILLISNTERISTADFSGKIPVTDESESDRSLIMPV